MTNFRVRPGHVREWMNGNLSGHEKSESQPEAGREHNSDEMVRRCGKGYEGDKGRPHHEMKGVNGRGQKPERSARSDRACIR